MEEKNRPAAKRGSLTLLKAVIIGIVLVLAAVPISVYIEILQSRDLAESAAATLKTQCASFSRVVATDRTKSLFRMTGLLRDFRSRLADEPELVDDAALEEYVDSLRISGVVLLNGELETDASGYTRSFRSSGWTETDLGRRFADILTHPAKIFAERVEADGEFYDLCAMARQDAPGIIIGFYKQPTGLVSDSESDLESMLSGLYLENRGHYVIFSGGRVSATSDPAFNGADVDGSDFLRQLSGIEKDGQLHQFAADGQYWWGYRSAYEDYGVMVYYPALSVFSDCFVTVGIVVVIYLIACVMIFALRNRALAANQEKLRESNQRLTETVTMLKSLETIYFCLFYVDVRENVYKTVYVAPWLENIVPANGDFGFLKDLFLSMMVVEKYRDEIAHVLSYEYICDNLSRDRITEMRRSFYADYQATRDDEIRWCRVSATVADYDEDGKPRHVLALLQDVDKEKAREAAYQARIEKEAQEAKVANSAKDEFLRRISHDIRTPINGIRGYIQLGADHPEDQELQQHCRDSATIALDTLLELVNSLFDMSKLENGDIVLEDKPFDIMEMLEEVNVVVIPQAQAKNISYEVLRKGDLPVTRLIGSPRHAKQILYNISGNAVKYGREGGYVRVNTRMVSRTEDTVTYEFICSDNGIGMSAEFQAHLFEPFSQEAQTARSTYQGAGLGLSIVKKLVDALGGTITCQSEKNVGTTFTTRLTFRVDKDYRQPGELEQQPSRDCLNGLNILLVEDNELNMEIADMVLTSHGASVTKAWNGQEAVDTFRVSDVGFYDAVCMDIMMPVMDGMTAAREIRALDRPDAGTVTIIAMSANAFPDDVRASLDSGMNAHLPKPLVVRDVLSTILRYCRKD